MDALKFSIILLAIIAVNVPTILAEIAFVRPNSSSECPGEPCLTLDEYARNATDYFNPGTEFIFLAGEHFLTVDLYLGNTHNISLTGDKEVEILIEYGDIRLISSTDILFNFLLIQYMTSALTIDFSHSIAITNVTFMGQSNWDYMRAISSRGSSVRITDCSFSGGKTRAIEDIRGLIKIADTSNFTFSGNNLFTNITVGDFAAVVNVDDSVAAFNGVNTFYQNKGLISPPGSSLASSSSLVLASRYALVEFCGVNYFRENSK